MNEITSILVLVFGTLLFTLFAVFTILFVALQKKKQYQHKIEKQGLELEKKELEHKFASELMQSKLEVQEQTMKQYSEELHDNVAQLLGIAQMNLHEVVTQSTDSTKIMAESSVEMIGEAINDIRNMSRVMNSSFILKKGLKESIEYELKHISTSKRIECDFNYTGSFFSLGEERELLTFRIIQEAVGNAVKHASANRINVTLSYTPEQLTVSIKDNGQGFDVADKLSTGGLGLSNMHERIELLEGTLKIESAENAGTTIQLHIPATNA